MTQAETTLALAAAAENSRSAAGHKVAKKIKIKKPKSNRINLTAAVSCFQSGDYGQAEAICSRVLLDTPDSADAWHLLGLIALQVGQYEGAVHFISRAVGLNPSEYVYHYNFGLAFAYQGNEEKAEECFFKTIELKPDHAQAYNNIGNLYRNRGMQDKAIESYRKALTLNPDIAEAHNNLGLALAEKGLLEEALENYKTALTLNPYYAEAFFNAGNACSEMGLHNEAIINYKKAIALSPEDERFHTNLGMVCLLIKDFETGWKEYEWTLRENSVPSLKKPEWDGKSPEGKTIYVYPEHGFGDTIQFARYLPVLRSHGAKKVLFRCPPGLETLFMESDLKAEIICNSVSEKELKFDAYTSLLRLPRIFGTNLENLPFRQKRYLKANEGKVREYREKYFSGRKIGSAEVGKTGDEEVDSQCNHKGIAPATPLKIGIFWQGNPALAPDKRRSMPLHYFYPLCRLPNVKIYSLQKGHGIEQLDEIPGDIDIVNLGVTFSDFSDTAAAIENLDLMITVDTAIGHLSGALGKKTWILLPSHAEWRWHLDLDYSPWYEDVRLFRHREPGKKDWAEMMEKVVEQIKVEGRQK